VSGRVQGHSCESSLPGADKKLQNSHCYAGARILTQTGKFIYTVFQKIGPLFLLTIFI